MKLVLLLALVTAQRAQNLSLLKITNMFCSESGAIFCLDERVIQSRVSNSGPLAVLRLFTENKILCVVHTLDIFLRKTELLRGPDCGLFIGLHKSHAAVGVDSISWWMKLSSLKVESTLRSSPVTVRDLLLLQWLWTITLIYLLLWKLLGGKTAGTFGMSYMKLVCDVSFSTGVLSNTHHTP